MLPACEMTYAIDEHYHETAQLRDGRLVTLRSVRPDDKALLRRGFERLSPESRYRRFLSTKKRLSDDELSYLTEVDGISHFALGATARDADGSECGVGIARFVCSADDPSSAEPAIAVADDWQHAGLGTLLLRRLVEAARERGVQRFEGRALASNAALFEVLAPLEADVHVTREGADALIGVELPAVAARSAAAEAAAAAAEKNSMERLLELAAKQLFGFALRIRRRRDDNHEDEDAACDPPAPIRDS